MPSLVLIDGGLGQLHAAAEALEALEIINQPLASIAKREEILYVYGQEKDPLALDHHSPVLHLINSFVTKPTASPSPSIANAGKCATAPPNSWKSPASAKAPLAAFSSTSAACKLSGKRMRRRYRRSSLACRPKPSVIIFGSRVLPRIVSPQRHRAEIRGTHPCRKKRGKMRHSP